MTTGKGMLDRVDVVAVLEAVYAEAPDCQTWLAGLLSALGADIEQMSGMAVAVDVRGEPYPIAYTGDSLLSAEQLARAMAPDVGKYSKLWASRSVTTASGTLGSDMSALGATSLLRENGIHPADYLAVTAVDPSGIVLGCSFALGRISSPSAGDQRRGSRLGAHMAAGFRLRDRDGWRSITTEQGEVSAVLDPGGKVLHAQGAAVSVEARKTLRQAARQIDAARTKSGREDSTTALQCWQALVAGTWSLVDVFESDRRRFLVARENEPGAPSAPQLSLRERQVVAYSALGHSQKLIAYTLGISTSAVSLQLKCACRKLGVASTVQLAAVLGWGAAVVGQTSEPKPHPRRNNHE